MAHAGISPDWDLETAKSCAAEVEQILQHGDFHYLIENMYSEQPDRWSPDLQGLDRYRYIINSFYPECVFVIWTIALILL